MQPENALRGHIIEVARKMSREGLSPGRSGNVSVRFSNGFLITPTGMAYENLAVDDIVYLDLDGTGVPRERRPSSEWRFHRDIYREFPDVSAVVHCHARHATALACAGRSIPAFHYMVAAAGGKEIPIAPYATFGSQALSDHIVKTLKRYRGALMEHHGLVATGRSVDAAYDLATEIEALAAQYLLVLGLGEARLLSDEQMDEVLERFRTYGKQPLDDEEEGSGLIG